MKKCVSLVVVVLVLISLIGCGGVSIRKITKNNPDEEGLRFYRPAPYLVVTKDPAKGNVLKYAIEYLPNMSEEYAIQTKAGIGTVDNKYVLTNGWNLTDYNDKRDSKATDWLTSLAGLVEKTTGLVAQTKGVNLEVSAEELTGKKDGTQEVTVPGLYSLIYDANGMISGVKQIIKF